MFERPDIKFSLHTYTCNSVVKHNEMKSDYSVNIYIGHNQIFFYYFVNKTHGTC